MKKAIFAVAATVLASSVAFAQAPKGGTTLAGQDNGMKAKHSSTMMHSGHSHMKMHKKTKTHSM